MTKSKTSNHPGSLIMISIQSCSNLTRFLRKIKNFFLFFISACSFIQVSCHKVQSRATAQTSISYREKNLQIDSIYFTASFPEFSYRSDTAFANQINSDIDEVVHSWLQLRDTSIMPAPLVSWYCQLDYKVFQTSGDTLSFLIEESSQAGDPRPQLWFHSFNYVISQRKRIFLKDTQEENNTCKQKVKERTSQMIADLQSPFDCKVADRAGNFHEFVIRGDSIYFCIDDKHVYHGCNIVLVGFKKDEVKDCFRQPGNENQ